MRGAPIKLVLSYDGTDFGGWQRQKNARSVQEDIEKALEKMHGHPVRLTGAGRTDAGVHAMGQAAGFFTDIGSIPAEKFLLALNKLLPRDIRILSACDASPDFHARFDASLRRYRYFIMCGERQDAFSQRYVWFVPRFPSITKLNAMASVIVGEHDFSAFASAKDISRSKSRFVRNPVFGLKGANSSTRYPRTPSCGAWSAPWSERCCFSSPRSTLRKRLRRACATCWKAWTGSRLARRRRRRAFSCGMWSTGRGRMAIGGGQAKRPALSLCRVGEKGRTSRQRRHLGRRGSFPGLGTWTTARFPKAEGEWNSARKKETKKRRRGECSCRP